MTIYGACLMRALVGEIVANKEFRAGAKKQADDVVHLHGIHTAMRAGFHN